MGQTKEGRSCPAVGSYVLIAASCVVAGPTDICDGVIIGANSVVVGSIDKSGVYVGAPARFLRSLNDDEKTMLRITE